MAHGKALELRGIRSRLAKIYWTKRHGPDHPLGHGVQARQSVRQRPKGSTSENRFVTMTRPETYLRQRVNYYAGDLYGHPSPMSRARLRFEARRHYYGRRGANYSR